MRTASEFKHDFHLDTDGPHPSVFLLTPLSQAAREWVAINIDPDATWLGNGVGIETRYVRDIVEGLQADGLSIDARLSR